MRSISKLARLRAARRDLKAVEEWNGSFVGGEEKEDIGCRFWTTIDMSVVRKFPSLLDGGSVMFELEGQTMDDVCRVVVRYFGVLGSLPLLTLKSFDEYNR